MSDLRTEWTCSDCGCRAYKATGEPFPPPIGFDVERDLCLACRDEKPDTDQRATEMLLAGRRDHQIRELCGMGRTRLADLKQGLLDSGDLDPEVAAAAEERDRASAAKADEAVAKKQAARLQREERERKSREEKRRSDKEIKTALETDPSRSTRSIAKEFGVDKRRVVDMRTKLGMKSPREVAVEAAEELLRSDPVGLNDGQVAEAVQGIGRAAVTELRASLGLPTAKAKPRGRTAQTPEIAREQAEAMLRADPLGTSDRTISEAVSGISRRAITTLREELGLPKSRVGRRPTARTAKKKEPWVSKRAGTRAVPTPV